jgi:hypothetical protein
MRCFYLQIMKQNQVKKENRMNKLKWLRILNIFVILDFLAVSISIFLYLFSPFQYMRGNETLGEIHEIGGKILFILIVLHVILNWNWIQAQYLKKKKQAPNPSKKSK